MHVQPSVSTKGQLGLQAIISPLNPTVDIILIHGLRGDSSKTWTHKESGVFWPAQLLSHDLPTARIMSFGYDSSVFEFFGQVGLGTVRDHASTLVAEVATDRKKAGASRPIILVAHSLGGLVAKKAILLSGSAVEEGYKILERDLRGICFLGTPHRGSSLAALGSAVSKVVGLACTVNQALVEILRHGSEMAWDLHSDFCIWLRKNAARSNVLCFWEERKHPVVGLVVDKASAAIEGYMLMPIPDDHVGMTKFAGTYSPGYRRILGGIQSWLDQPVQEIGDKRTTTIEIAAAVALPGLSKPGQALLRLLWFPHIFAREDSIMPPLGNTSSWIHKHEAFVKWKTSKCGTFWILGFPGTGKSTIMKHLVDSHSSDDTMLVLSHFFLESGAPLQQSIVGALRSLIYQIMKKVPSSFASGIEPMHTRKIFDESDPLLVGHWDKNDLLVYFNLALAHVLETRNVQIYIDDLHQCRGSHEDVRNLYRYFQGLVDTYSSTPRRLALCLSSRYFPVYAPIVMASCAKVEEELPDLIYEYVNSELVLSHTDSAKSGDKIPSTSDISFRHDIAWSARKNFLWAASAINKAQSMFQAGQSIEAIPKAIEATIPDTLFQMLKTALQSASSPNLGMARRLFHLICMGSNSDISISTFREVLNGVENIATDRANLTDAGVARIIDDDHLERLLPTLSFGLCGVTRFGVWTCIEPMHNAIPKFMEQYGFHFLYQSDAPSEVLHQRGALDVLDGLATSTAAALVRLQAEMASMSDKYEMSVLDDCAERLTVIGLSDEFYEAVTEHQDVLGDIIGVGDPDLTHHFMKMKMTDNRPSDAQDLDTDFDASIFSYTNPASGAASPEIICCVTELLHKLLALKDVRHVKQMMLLWLRVIGDIEAEGVATADLCTAYVRKIREAAGHTWEWFWSKDLFIDASDSASSADRVQVLRALLDRDTTALQPEQMRRCLTYAWRSAEDRDAVLFIADDPDFDNEGVIAGESHLIRALQGGDSKTVKLLLERGASLLAKSAKGKSVLDLALLSDTQDADIISAVLEHLHATRSSGGDPTALGIPTHEVMSKTINEATAQAIVNKDLPVVRRLLSEKIDLTTYESQEEGDEGKSLLHLAVEAQNYTIMNLLLKAGANVHAVDKKGRTPLHLAARVCDSTACTVFLIRGAQVDLPDADGNTPLYSTVEYLFSDKFTSAVKTLLNFKANIATSFQAQSSKLYKSLLEAAFDHGKVEAAQMLLDAGARAMFQTQYSKDILSYCLDHGSNECARMIVKREDTNVNAVDGGGHPLIVTIVGGESYIKSAERYQFERELLDLLLLRDDLDVNQMDNYERTALHYAVKENRTEMVATLLQDPRTDPNGGIPPIPRFSSRLYHAQLADLGADKGSEIGEYSHYVPIFLAAKEGNLEIVKLLLAHPKLVLYVEEEGPKQGSRFHPLGCLQAASQGLRNPAYGSCSHFDSNFVEIVRLLCPRPDIVVNKRTIGGTALDLASDSLRLRQEEVETLQRYHKMQKRDRVKTLKDKHWLSIAWGKLYSTPADLPSSFHDTLDEYDERKYEKDDQDVLRRVKDLREEIEQRRALMQVLKEFGAISVGGWPESWSRGDRQSSSAAFVSGLRCLFGDMEGA